MRIKSSNRFLIPDVSLASNAADRDCNPERHRQIAEAAYFLSVRRLEAGELPDELRDWLEAERAIDLVLKLLRGHVHSPDEI